MAKKVKSSKARTAKKTIATIGEVKKQVDTLILHPLNRSLRTSAEGAGRTAEKVDLYLPNGDLCIDSKYAEGVSSRKVRKIVDEFDWHMVNPVKVSVRDGKLHVFDGRATLMAIREFFEREDVPVKCTVFFNLKEADEARFYAVQDDNRTKLSMPYKLRALETAKDPVVISFLSETRDAGFEIELGDKRGRNGKISAVCAAYDAYLRLGENQYRNMLILAKKTWGGQSWSITKNMISGLTVFVNMNSSGGKAEYDAEYFIDIMGTVGPEDLRSAARRHKDMTMGTAYGKAIDWYYRHKTA